MDEARRSRVRVRAEHPNRLRAMQTNDVAYANGVPGQRVEMTYDGQSRRVRKVGTSFSAQSNTWSVTSGELL